MVKFSIDIEKTLELGVILKKERERANLTTQEVSKKTSISTTDINYIENGKRNKINPFMLKKICKLYELNLLEIYKMIGYIDDENLTQYQKFSEIKYEIMGNNKIPVYLLNSDKNDFLKGTPSFYIQLPVDNKFLKAVDLRNNLINDKMLALFNTDINKLENGEVGIFLHDKKYLITEYYINKNNIILLPFDKKEEPIVLTNNSNLQILGKLLMFI